MVESKARLNGHPVQARKIGSRAQTFNLSTSQLIDVSYEFIQWISVPANLAGSDLGVMLAQRVPVEVNANHGHPRRLPQPQVTQA